LLTCTAVYQYDETNVMQFSFNLFENQGLLHVSSITCSSSGGSSQTARGVLRACYVSWLCHAIWHYTHAMYHVPFEERLLRMSR
jgi:hypothetical protein